MGHQLFAETGLPYWRVNTAVLVANTKQEITLTDSPKVLHNCLLGLERIVIHVFIYLFITTKPGLQAFSQCRN